MHESFVYMSFSKQHQTSSDSRPKNVHSERKWWPAFLLGYSVFEERAELESVRRDIQRFSTERHTQLYGKTDTQREASPLGWASSKLEASAIQLGHVADRCILTNNNRPRRYPLDRKNKHDIIIKREKKLSPIFLITMLKRSARKCVVVGSRPVGNTHRPSVVG